MYLTFLRAIHLCPFPAATFSSLLVSCSRVLPVSFSFDLISDHLLTTLQSFMILISSTQISSQRISSSLTARIRRSHTTATFHRHQLPQPDQPSSEGYYSIPKFASSTLVRPHLTTNTTHQLCRQGIIGRLRSSLIWDGASPVISGALVAFS